MKFGQFPVADLRGAILAHSQRLGDGRRIAKGTRLGPAEIEQLRAEGIVETIAAVLGEADVPEDEAAARIGASLAGGAVRADAAATGRVNLFADVAGVFRPDRDVVDALNRIDPAITLATLADYASVQAGDMVATVKIIPLAVPGGAVDAAAALAGSGATLAVSPYRPRRVRLVQTRLPGTKTSVLDKTARVTAGRLARSGSAIVEERRCPHDAASLSAVLAQASTADVTIVFGASAVIDPNDVLPAAIRDAGGAVHHIGMPVDPGNLLLLGTLGGNPVIGAPGCARSPKENGFDWVLNRLMADIDVTPEGISGLGVGGLLLEIPTRPQLRDRPAESKAPRVAVVVLAAGRSSRMNGPNKLLATFDGIPLIRRSVATALATTASQVVVVVGHSGAEMAEALDGLDVAIVDNPDYADGLSTSVRAGFRSASEGMDGVLLMLADQPLLTAADLDRMIAAFRPANEGAIVLATAEGKRGNPVVLATRFAPEIEKLAGDVGARGIVAANDELVREVELGLAASLDIDTPEALARAGGLIAVDR